MISLIGSFAGLVLSFYAKPPLKLIGMIINSIVLSICVLGLIAVIAFYVAALYGAFDPAMLSPLLAA